LPEPAALLLSFDVTSQFRFRLIPLSADWLAGQMELTDVSQDAPRERLVTMSAAKNHEISRENIVDVLQSTAVVLRGRTFQQVAFFCLAYDVVRNVAMLLLS
jgi:hypothetical protein